MEIPNPLSLDLFKQLLTTDYVRENQRDKIDFIEFLEKTAEQYSRFLDKLNGYLLLPKKLNPFTNEDLTTILNNAHSGKGRLSYDFDPATTAELIKTTRTEINYILYHIKDEIIRYKIMKGEDKIVHSKDTKIKTPRTGDINFKFALLEEMGVIKWLNTNIPTNNKDRAEILQHLVGGSVSTLEDYLKGKPINKEVRQKALDVLNEKRFN